MLICGGVGGGAQVALAEAGIELYGGVTGSADDAQVVAFPHRKSCILIQMCTVNHHHHEEGHDCGSQKHGCAGSEAGH